jgi:phenylpyruvate tautomerase PptA (4-oxalocrotonate tautomerase family)
MPHMNVLTFEEDLDGEVEALLIARLTEAVVEVYGERARELVVVELFGVPRGRWGRGGRPAAGDERAARVTLNMREPALHRPEIEGDIPALLIRSLTDGVVDVLGESVRGDVTVVVNGIPTGRSGVGGQPV